VLPVYEEAQGTVYSHYSVISIAIYLQLLTVLRLLWVDLRSAAVR